MKSRKKLSLPIYAIICLQLLAAQHFFAQSRITTVIQKEKGNPSGYGRDFWFCIPQNSSEGDNSTKYFNVYVTSPRNTTVYFQRQGYPIVAKPVTANKVTIFTTPTPSQPSNDFTLSAELTSSGDVETSKAIHIWSDNADLSVSFLSRVPFSSDGTYIIPTMLWGKEYVVGAYASNLALPSTDDEPSEFAVVANQDNTLVNIIPTQDIRQNGNADAILHPKGIQFSEMLNRGQCVQYKVTRAKDETWDVSGTVVTSNNPIGVFGASTCPFIQPSEGYCDYILEMMQPVNSWSNNYFTAPFAGRKYGGDGFLVIGTKDQQVITPNPGIPFTVNKYQPFFTYDIDVNTPLSWTSKDPFMLMQYICSATHGQPIGTQRNQGDPASVVIDGADHFAKNILFQIPIIVPGSGQSNFTNYVNILVPTSNLIHTTYDGQVLATTPPALPAPAPSGTAMQKFTIGTTGWTAVRLAYTTAGNGQGNHLVVSDTGVGVYTYGYGTDDSYAWSGHLGGTSAFPTDTIPPVAIVNGSCFSLHVSLSDTGANASKIGFIQFDSLENMLPALDTSFIPGVGLGNTFYNLNIIDSLHEAYASISVYDLAGNKTTVINTYTPEIIAFKPALLNFGKVQSGVTAYLYDTIVNAGKLPYQFLQSQVTGLGRGFSLDSAGADGTLAPGQMRILKIKYVSADSTRTLDSLFLSDTCQSFMLALAANNVAGYSLSDYDFGCIDSGTQKQIAATILINTGTGKITIDSIRFDDPKHFSFGGTLPVVINENNSAGFIFTYSATAKEFDTTLVHFYSTEGGERIAKLTGCGQIPAAVSAGGYSSSLQKGSAEYERIASELDRGSAIAILPPAPNPTNGKISVRFVFGLSSYSSIDLSIFDILGHVVAPVTGGYYPAGIYETEISIPSSMQAGEYIYRLAGEGKVISGKIIISN